MVIANSAVPILRESERGRHTEEVPFHDTSTFLLALGVVVWVGY